MSQYDFKMTIVEGDDGFPVLVLEFSGLAANLLAQKLTAVAA